MIRVNDGPCVCVYAHVRLSLCARVCVHVSVGVCLWYVVWCICGLVAAHVLRKEGALPPGLQETADECCVCVSVCLHALHLVFQI